MERAEYKNGPPPAEFVLELARDRDHWKQTVERLERELSVIHHKYQTLVNFYDKHNGTPCEQIRHQAEVADLQAQLAAAQADADRCRSIAFQAEPVTYWCEKAQAAQQHVNQLMEERKKHVEIVGCAPAYLTETLTAMKAAYTAHTTLQGLVEQLDKMTPKRPTAISVEQAWTILDYIQDVLLPAYRATLPREGGAQPPQGKMHSCDIPECVACGNPPVADPDGGEHNQGETS